MSVQQAPKVDVAALRVKDLEGRETSLQDIAAKKPVLLVFVRHFG